MTVKQKLVIPLDEYLGTDTLPFKMTKKMMAETAFWGQNQTSFKSAEKISEAKFGIKITDDHIRKVTLHVGKSVHEADTQRAEEVYGNMVNMAYTRDKEGVLYIGRSGTRGKKTRTIRHGGRTNWQWYFRVTICV